MKSLFKNTGLVLMAFMVLFSTFSFNVNKHFCGENLVGASVFSSAEKCNMEMASCGREGNFHMAMEESCCSNKKEKIEGQDELEISVYSFKLQQVNYFIALSFIFPELLSELPLTAIPDTYYKPPLLVTNIQVMDQVFII
jgi:hypothetical protein